MRTLICIPARRAATRLPNKPLADIGGKPMIVRVWEQAMAADAGPVMVACDDEEIAKVIHGAGGKAVMTASNHPSGSDRVWEAVQTMDASGDHDVIVNLQGDLPTFEPSLIDDLLMPLENTEVSISTLAAEITDPQEKAAKSVVKPVISFYAQGQGRALYFTRAPAPMGIGPMYHHIGVYGYRREALQRFVSLPPSALEQQEKLEQLRALEAGMRIDVRVVEAVPLGVDTPQDLEKIRSMTQSG